MWNQFFTNLGSIFVLVFVNFSFMYLEFMRVRKNKLKTGSVENIFKHDVISSEEF